ncbi:MAG: GNAT family N-acetyltransferase [Anaerolineae bacterium]|nr:GNAT family N-acetyltransferase [Anaerolineae bacterium]
MLADEVIYLRRLEATDLDRTWEWIHTPEIALAIGVNIPVSRTAQLRWFERLDQATDKIVFAVCFRDNNEHIGNVSLDSIDYRHRNARFSIFLTDPTIRRQGIGTRAMRLLIQYAFEFLNLNRLYCKTTSDNHAIIAFYRNLGFCIEGRLREHEYIQGHYVDKIILGLILHDWACEDNSV